MLDTKMKANIETPVERSVNSLPANANFAFGILLKHKEVDGLTLRASRQGQNFAENTNNAVLWANCMYKWSSTLEKKFLSDIESLTHKT